MASKGFTYKVDRKKDSFVEVEVKSDRATYDRHYESAYLLLASSVKIAGFRPGKAPRPQIEAKIGTDVYARAIQTMLPQIAADIVGEENLNPVTQLEYDLKKLDAEGVEFTFTFTNYPEVKLPKLEKMVVEVELNEEVSDKDVQEVIERLYQSEERNKQKAEGEAEEGEKKFSLKMVTNEMVEKWNINGAKTVEELQEQIKSRLSEIKHQQNHSKLESAILEELVKNTSFEVPTPLLEQQTQELMQQYFSRIDELNLSREDFLSAQGTSEDELKKQKEDEARNKIAVDLVLNEVAKEFKIFPTDQEVELQIAAVADPALKQNLSTPNGRRYIQNMLMQSAALHKLEDVVQVKQIKKPAAKKTDKAEKSK